MPTEEEVREKVLRYLETSGRVKARGIAKAIEVDKPLADAVVRQLAKEDKIEYFYLDTTYVALKRK